jgi:hypothetical protein
MKKLYILSLSLLSVASVNSQVVFTSDLSSWASGLPTDFKNVLDVDLDNRIDLDAGSF